MSEDVLRGLAEKAEREHWDMWSVASWSPSDEDPDWWRLAPNVRVAHRDFAVAASPDVVIGLLDRIAALEKAAGEVMRLLEQYGPSIVPHLIDTDENAGQRLRDLLEGVD